MSGAYHSAMVAAVQRISVPHNRNLKTCGGFRHQDVELQLAQHIG